MGKGAKKGKGKKKKGPEKPESMTDEHWLLYNNFDSLMQNLRGKASRASLSSLILPPLKVSKVNPVRNS